jgi:hypothetical protein
VTDDQPTKPCAYCGLPYPTGNLCADCGECGLCCGGQLDLDDNSHEEEAEWD